jgi:hypothetical protein
MVHGACVAVALLPPLGELEALTLLLLALVYRADEPPQRLQPPHDDKLVSNSAQLLEPGAADIVAQRALYLAEAIHICSACRQHVLVPAGHRQDRRL